MIRHLLTLIGKAQAALAGMDFQLHEVHHSQKVDAPSGTALKWQEWLGLPQLKISYDRQGDVVGIHELTITGAMEKLQLRHQALDRKLFACGALWAAQKILEDPRLPYGMMPFENLVDRYIQRNDL